MWRGWWRKDASDRGSPSDYAETPASEVSSASSDYLQTWRRFYKEEGRGDEPPLSISLIDTNGKDVGADLTGNGIEETTEELATRFLHLQQEVHDYRYEMKQLLNEKKNHHYARKEFLEGDKKRLKEEFEQVHSMREELELLQADHFHKCGVFDKLCEDIKKKTEIFMNIRIPVIVSAENAPNCTKCGIFLAELQLLANSLKNLAEARKLASRLEVERGKR